MKKKLLIFTFMAVLLVMTAGCAPGSPLQLNLNTPAPNAKAATPAPGGQITVPGMNIQTYAPGPNPMVDTPDTHGSPAGILLGIWHGVISPVTLISSFMNSGVQMYEVHNDGKQYNLGFFLGMLLLIGVLSAVIGLRRR